MARRANTTLLGLFIVGAIVLAVGAALLFGSGLLREKSLFVMFFNGSVKGLSVGAPVNFRGVKIGTVTDIRLLLDPDTQRVQIPVYVELEPNRISLVGGEEMNELKMRRMGHMINNGLRAQLQMQSLLTGQLAIQLDMHPDKPITLVGTREHVIEIPTIPTPIQEFTRKIEEFPIDVLLHDLASAAAGIDKFVNGPELMQALKQFDQTMQDYSVLTKEYRVLGQRLDQRSEQITTDLNVTLNDVRTTLQSTQGLIGAGTTVMNSTHELVTELRRNSDKLTASAEETLAAINTTSTAINTTSRTVNQLIAEDSPLQQQLSDTLEEVTSSARALRILANTLEQNPEALLKGKPEDPED